MKKAKKKAAKKYAKKDAKKDDKKQIVTCSDAKKDGNGGTTFTFVNPNEATDEKEQVELFNLPNFKSNIFSQVVEAYNP